MTLLGGFGGSLLVVYFERRSARSLHRAALLAVFAEIASNNAL
jgi:hypothetical protein